MHCNIVFQVLPLEQNPFQLRMQIKFLTDNKNLIDEVNNFVEEWRSNSLFITTETSGSTGTPKSLEHTKKHMSASALKTIEALNLKNGCTNLLCLSPRTIGGKMMIVRTIILKSRLIVVDISSSPLKDITEKIDFAAMVPLQVQNSLESERDSLSKVGTLIIGGGVMDDAILKNASLLPIKAYQTFGMTETISHIALKRIQTENSLYIAVRGVTFEQDGEQLLINAPHLGIEGLKTNDTIELINDTSFNWLGRTDFVVNSGGIKLQPELIEIKLSSIIKSPFFVSGMADQKLGEKLILCIESHSPSLEITKSTLISILSKYEIPKEIYYFDQFVRTDSDKINRIATMKNSKNAERKIL